MQLSDLGERRRNARFRFCRLSPLLKTWLFVLACCPWAPLGALEVTPTYQIFELKPGEKTNGELTLTSTEATDLKITVQTTDRQVLPENKGIKVGDWFKVDRDPFVLKKGEAKRIRFSVHAPKKAKGELIGKLSFTSKSHEGAMLSFRLSVAMYLVIQGTERKEGMVKAISVIPSTDTTVSYLFANTGNVHLRPKGLLRIYDEKDVLVANVVYDQSLPTFPGKTEAYTTAMKNRRFPAGRYKAVITLQDADWNLEFPNQMKKFSVSEGGKVEGR